MKELSTSTPFTLCENMRGFATEDPVAYAFSHPEAKRLLQAVLEEGGRNPEDIRTQLGLHPETFRRVLRRLAQFDLVTIRAAPGAKVRNRRIPVVVEPSKKTEKTVKVLQRLDQVVVENADVVGQKTVKHLAVL
ncbi:MAG: helix-turn-helix transcriptional regulator [Nitrososphaerota archaeon]|jgi:DNA-binding MarR family transcriptional regulator|nr:helix-turn-helix transcriptional regulator [Nitrososphaerota archaeon]